MLEARNLLSQISSVALHADRSVISGRLGTLMKIMGIVTRLACERTIQIETVAMLLEERRQADMRDLSQPA